MNVNGAVAWLASDRPGRGVHPNDHVKASQSSKGAFPTAVTWLPLTEARDHFEAQGARDGLVELSGMLRTVAVSLAKICNDLR